MRVTFTWSAEEWREACLLSSAGTRKRAHFSINYCIVGVMLLGGLCDVLRTVSLNSLRGSVFPALLLVAVVLAGVFLYARRRNRLRALTAPPHGEQCFRVSEVGWSAHPAHLSPEEQIPWTSLQGYCAGGMVLSLWHRQGEVTAVPLRALTDDQKWFLRRLLARKLSGRAVADAMTQRHVCKAHLPAES